MENLTALVLDSVKYGQGSKIIICKLYLICCVHALLMKSIDWIGYDSRLDELDNGGKAKGPLMGCAVLC